MAAVRPMPTAGCSGLAETTYQKVFRRCRHTKPRVDPRREEVIVTTEDVGCHCGEGQGKREAQ